MSDKWRVTFSPAIRQELGDVFPDAHKMPIAKRLKEWDIDVMKVPLYTENLRGGVAAMAEPGGSIVMGPEGLLMKEVISERLKTDWEEWIYLMLSHELAHLLQMAEGRIDEKIYDPAFKGYGHYHTDSRAYELWFSMEHERDAVRWGARQAKAMGMSETKFRKLESLHLVLHGPIKKMVHPVFTGEHPEERGVRPLFRRPVRVRSHVRRRTFKYR